MDMSAIKREYWKQFTYEQRLAMTAASRALITGKKRSHEDLCKRAKGKEQKAKLSRYESLLFEALYSNGFCPIAHMAVDKFNIDLAFLSKKLAVELDGGCWHNTAKKIRQDEAKQSLLESKGWTIIRIKARRKQWADIAVRAITLQLQVLPIANSGLD
jgi:very-short-patch-repair endonuclease